jgi:hypothetical protein
MIWEESDDDNTKAPLQGLAGTGNHHLLLERLNHRMVFSQNCLFYGVRLLVFSLGQLNSFKFSKLVTFLFKIK